MAILGLVSSDKLKDRGFLGRNVRRHILHLYPSGSAPLNALLSLKKAETTDNPDFGWLEKRFATIKTTGVSNDSAGPFADTGTADATAGPIDFTANGKTRVYVASNTDFKPGHVIRFHRVPVTGGVTSFNAVVDSLVSTNALEVRVVGTPQNVLNTANTITAGTAGPVNVPISVVGTAHGEGTIATLSRQVFPITIMNKTQIFKEAFSFTRTALKNPTEFDKTGAYKEAAQDAAIDLMVSMELAFLDGERGEALITDTDGEEVMERKMGGIRWFLDQYEAADSVYRGGTGAPAITGNDDSLKRVIDGTGGITYDEMLSYWERLFKIGSNKGNEKLCLAGSGHLTAINKMIQDQVVTNRNMKAEDTYGMNIKTIETPYGIIHFVTHPLLNEQPFRNNDAYYIDLANIRERPLTDREVTLEKCIQANGADRRKDQYITETSLELRAPESHMIFENAGTITAS